MWPAARASSPAAGERASNGALTATHAAGFRPAYRVGRELVHGDAPARLNPGEQRGNTGEGR
jgi:hypothetical protein